MVDMIRRATLNVYHRDGISDKVNEMLKQSEGD